MSRQSEIEEKQRELTQESSGFPSEGRRGVNERHRLSGIEVKVGKEELAAEVS